VRLNQSRIEELYRNHVIGARRLAFLLTGDHADAEDLVQDAFVRVAVRLGDLRDPAKFPTYLNRTLVTMAASRFRRRKREQNALKRSSASAAIKFEAITESNDLVWQSLLSLPPRQRAALVLRFYLDLTEEQTADALGCPRGTVKSLWSRGLKAMRQSLDGGDIDEVTASAGS